MRMLASHSTSEEPTDQRSRVVSMRCMTSTPGESCSWHAHRFDELWLVTDGKTIAGHQGEQVPVNEGTLLLVRAGEKHGFWNYANSAARFWVVQFSPSVRLLPQLKNLTQSAAEDRIWNLSSEQLNTFRWIFLKLFEEHTHNKELSSLAETAWLELLLVTIHRWSFRQATQNLTPDVANPELVRLWHLINELAGQPEEFRRRIHSIPNYDSLRHCFRRAFGCPPGQMLLRLRMQQAKSLLQESTLSIKEIAYRLGYLRQHEFTRAFHKFVGMSPRDWRSNPFANEMASVDNGTRKTVVV